MGSFGGSTSPRSTAGNQGPRSRPATAWADSLLITIKRFAARSLRAYVPRHKVPAELSTLRDLPADIGTTSWPLTRRDARDVSGHGTPGDHVASACGHTACTFHG